MTPKIYAFDYETFYRDSRKKGAELTNYSIRTLGNWAYMHHPEFDAYMLSVAGSDGFRWVGNPKDFDWSIIQGAFMIAHNAGFETAVTQRLVELGIAPSDLSFAALFDTADLAAYLGFPRSLAEAAAGLLGIKPDKSARAEANGVHWADFTPEAQEKMRAYALEDSVLELRLWLEHGHRWPKEEQEISRLTREMCDAGLPVNLAAVHDGIAKLEVLLHKVRSKLPWVLDEEEEAALPKSQILTPLSRKGVAIECEKLHIAPPKSMAKDSEEFDEWLKLHGADVPWARAMGQYRSINMFLKKLLVMQLRTREDGIMPFSLKYAGAHTLRDSGDSGWNPQNLSRDPMFGELLCEHKVVPLPPQLTTDPEEYGRICEKECGLDMRKMIEAPPGFLLGVVDLSSIEPCTGAVLTGDEELRELLEGGMDVYEAQARLDGEYSGEGALKDVDKALRQYNKVKVLGCSYGAGAPKVQLIARQQVGLELSLEACVDIVCKFRARPFIKGMWSCLEENMRESVGRTCSVEVPNGGVMNYRAVWNRGSLSAVIPRQGRMMRLKFWGGTLYENLIQRVARDVFMDGVLRLHQNGLPPILRVHDEVVCLLPEKTADVDLARVIELMSVRPTWMPTLPLRAEGHLCRQYTKN